MEVTDEVLVRSVIHSVVTEHQAFEKLTQFSSKVWLEIFVKIFGIQPSGNTDPLWDKLLHDKKTPEGERILGGLSILSKLEKEYHEACERKKVEKRVAEYKRKQEEMMEKLRRSQ